MLRGGEEGRGPRAPHRPPRPSPALHRPEGLHGAGAPDAGVRGIEGEADLLCYPHRIHFPTKPMSYNLHHITAANLAHDLAKT